MKRISLILAAVTLVLGLSQCKKQEQEQPAPAATGETVTITLDANSPSGSKVDVNTTTGVVTFQPNDVVHVGSGGQYVGTLTCISNDGLFQGDIPTASLVEGEHLYFYFFGNQTLYPGREPVKGYNYYLVYLDQTSGGELPLVSFAKSEVVYTANSANYRAHFRNKAALVEFIMQEPLLSGQTLVLKGLADRVHIFFDEYGNPNNGIEGVVFNNRFEVKGNGSSKFYAIVMPTDGSSYGNLNTYAPMEEGAHGTAYILNANNTVAWTGKRPAFPNGIKENSFVKGVTVENVSVPTGALTGKFTINDAGAQVYFSKGNLQYNAVQGTHAVAGGGTAVGTWRFAENQYDYVGDATQGNVFEGNVKCNNALISSSYNGWIDLFGWGTSGWDCGNSYYNPWDYDNSGNSHTYLNSNLFGPSTGDLTGTYSDWGVYNAISNGGNQPNQWRTLTIDEWRHVLHDRKTTSGILFAKAVVNGVCGLILLPDNWDANYFNLNYPGVIYDELFSGNTISHEEWLSYFEPYGAVFLPSGGDRPITDLRRPGIDGNYWSSSSSSNSYSYYVGIYDPNPYKSYDDGIFTYPRNYGLSVRLVKDVN